MKVAVLVLLLLARSAQADLSRYAALVVADPAPPHSARDDGIRVTYLGVNGYQLEADGRSLLIDPYFTRASLWQVATSGHFAPDPARVSAGLRHIRSHVDAVLVTHAHFDHLLDVAPIMRQTGARSIAGPTAANLIQAVGRSKAECWIVQPGDRKTIGPWKITVLAAQHDRVLGASPPYPGRVATSTKAPEKASDWKLGEPLAFVIEANGQRIYLESGGRPDGPMPRVGKIDLAILGVALPESRRRYAAVVRALHPRFVLPSHQDDFFAPFARGFTFGKLTNFPEIVRTQKREALPGHLILLDYFRPWTLR